MVIVIRMTPGTPATHAAVAPFGPIPQSWSASEQFLPEPGVPLPFRLLMTDTLDSEALIGKLRVPVMILHGTADQNIPIAEARRLYAAAHEPKTMIEVEGAGHVQTWFGPTRDRALAALSGPVAPGGTLRSHFP